MKQNAVTLVQESWKKVTEIAPHTGELFYQNLFTADPSLKSLFKGDMDKQGKKLINMFNVAVVMLNNMETLTPILQGLAQNHVYYGVQDEHYQTVEVALLKTLEQGLGEDFTPDVIDAWSEVYGFMAEVMIAAEQP